MKHRELLTANELYRVDRIPKFVFSNACESGITPERAQERNDKLAPSFAEAFFGRGVANFVCTAWPVDDAAARTFALTVYSGLLGIDLAAVGTPTQDSKRDALPMHQAMQQARLATARTANGRTTWGAYQHYGNPYFQFFFPVRAHGRPEAARRTKRRPTKRATTKRRSKSSAKR